MQFYMYTGIDGARGKVVIQISLRILGITMAVRLTWTGDSYFFLFTREFSVSVVALTCLINVNFLKEIQLHLQCDKQKSKHTHAHSDTCEVPLRFGNEPTAGWDWLRSQTLQHWSRSQTLLSGNDPRLMNFHWRKRMSLNTDNCNWGANKHKHTKQHTHWS